MRMKHSLLNMLVATIPSLILPVIGFVKFSLFSNIYGGSINGLYSTMVQIMGVLSLVEGGFGIAFQQILYQPLAHRNEKKVTELYNGAIYLFRKIGIIILVLGVIVGAVQPLFISQTSGHISNFSIYSIYFLLLVPVVISYFLMGPNIVVQADQQYYKINLGIQIITLLRSILVIIIAMMGLALQVVLVLDGILSIASYVYSREKALKLYPYLRNNREGRDVSALENTKHVFVHKVAGVTLSNTDPLLITYFISPLMTNVYNAYNMICSSLIRILYGIIQAPADSFGNLFSSNDDHKHSVFLQYVNFSFFLSSIVSSILFITANDFVRLWMKNDIYVLSYTGVFLFTMNTYYLVSREPLLVVRNVNGLFKETKKIAILSVIINLGLSLFLVKPLGVVGILFGTFIMYFLVDFRMSVELVYPVVFKTPAREYYMIVLTRTIIMFILTILGIAIWKIIFPTGVANMFNWFLGAAGIGIIFFVTYLLIYYLLFKEFRVFSYRLTSLLRNRSARNK